MLFIYYFLEKKKKTRETECLRNVFDNRSTTPRRDHHRFNCWQQFKNILLVGESQFSRHTLIIKSLSGSQSNALREFYKYEQCMYMYIYIHNLKIKLYI